MFHSELEDFRLYKAERLRTERSVTEVRYRYYKYESVQCLLKECESRYQIRERKQIILTVKLTCISERLSADSLSHTQE